MQEQTKNPHAVALGSLGGKARARAIPPERRKEISVGAVEMRWRTRGKLTMALAVAAVDRGEFSVDADGRIWRHTWRGKPCAARLAEYPNGASPYLVVSFQHEGKPYIVPAHRLVWSVLCGPIPDGLQINHLDGNQQNNRPDNMEVTDSSGNQLHCTYVLGRTTVPPHVPGEVHGMAKLTWESVTVLRRMRSDGASILSLMARFGIKRSQVTRIVKGQSWKEEFRPVE